MCACMCACMRVCACVCTRVCVCLGDTSVSSELDAESLQRGLGERGALSTDGACPVDRLSTTAFSSGGYPRSGVPCPGILGPIRADPQERNERPLVSGSLGSVCFTLQFLRLLPALPDGACAVRIRAAVGRIPQRRGGRVCARTAPGRLSPVEIIRFDT